VTQFAPDHGLRQAGCRVLEARAQLGITVGNILPQAHGVREIRVWIQFDLKLRRAPLAAEARENALKNVVPSQQRDGTEGIFSRSG